jgi:hypothetical protein
LFLRWALASLAVVSRWWNNETQFWLGELRVVAFAGSVRLLFLVIN